jgi:23S rRNA (uridine2552-2'-O)-methyltransferase
MIPLNKRYLFNKSRLSFMNISKRKTLSSQRWIDRNQKDLYRKNAKKDGYVCRSSYKLLEIDQKFNLLTKSVRNVIDLGAFPGGWSQVIAKKLSIFSNKYLIYGLDLRPITTEINNFHSIVADCLYCDLSSESILSKIFDMGCSANIDLVFSDMASNSCGDREVDHLRIIELAYSAFEIAKFFFKMYQKSKERLALVIKIFHGKESSLLVKDLKEYFISVSYFKPKSSYKSTSEIYLIAQNFKSQ